jgi:hypothetical protein
MESLRAEAGAAAQCLAAWPAKGQAMPQVLTKIIKVTVLAIASMLVPYAAGYEPLAVSICVGAIVFVQRMTRLKEYFWAAGLVAIAVVVSPLPLAFQMFLLTGFTCIATYVTLLGALRARPLPAD